MSTTRVPAAQRKHYGEYASQSGYDKPPLMEPALGSLDQRLKILVARHHGFVQTPRATDAERGEYLAWLAQNDPTATNPYAG